MPNITLSITSIGFNSATLNFSTDYGGVDPEGRPDCYWLLIYGGTAETILTYATEGTYTMTGLAQGTKYSAKLRLYYDAWASYVDYTFSFTTLKVSELQSVSFSSDYMTVDELSLTMVTDTPSTDVDQYYMDISSGNKITGFVVPESAIGVEYTMDVTNSIRNSILAYMGKIKYSGMSVTFTMYAYMGTTVVGSSSVTINVYADLEKITPVISDFTFADINEATIALTGDNQKLVQGASQLQVNVGDVSCEMGSIKVYSVDIGKKSVASSSKTINYGAPNVSGTVDITISALSSYNMSFSITKSVTIYEYSSPNFTSLEVARNNGGLGDYACLNATIKLSNVNDLNTIQGLTYKYRQVGTEEYSDEVAITEYTEASGIVTIDLDDFVAINSKNSYEFVIKATDKLTSSTDEAIVTQAIALINFRKESVFVNGALGSYGGYVEEDDWDSLKTAGVYLTRETTKYYQNRYDLLEVFNLDGMIVQIRHTMWSADDTYTPLTSSTVYIRRCTNGNWSAWR